MTNVTTIPVYVPSYTVTAPTYVLSVATSGSVGSGGVATETDGVYTVVNSGRIGTSATDTGVLIVRGGTVINDLGATIAAGGIGVSIGSGYENRGTHTSFGSVVNDGTIIADTGAGLYLGDNVLQGAFVTNGGTGNTTALISGRDGILDLAGVFSSVDATIRNFGTIQGTGGIGYAGVNMDGTPGTIVNGSSLDSHALIAGYIGIDGTGDGDLVVQNFGTVEGTGGQAVLLGSPSDTLIVEAGATFIGAVDGAGGTLVLAADAGAGTLAGLGTSFTNFNDVSVSSGAAWTLTGVNSIAAGTSLTNNGTLIDDGTLIDAGTIINGITLGAAASLLSVAATGLITSGATYGVAVFDASGGTVVSAGTIEATGTNLISISLDGGGSVTNQSGGTISGHYAINAVNGPATVVNAGSIGGTQAGGIGVFLHDGGTVANQSGGSIAGSGFGVSILAAQGTVVNAGSISSIGASGFGVDLTTGGSVTNQAGGVIDGYRGVEVLAAAGTVTNAGIIAGDSTPGEGLGVVLFAGGTLVNQSGGTISGGGDAVRFAAGYNGLLVIDPGAVFIGAVSGGNTAGATAVTTLQLAAGVAAGTLTGLGSQFVDFAQITIDSGASWTFAGSNTIGANYTLTDTGTLTNTGTLLNAGTLIDNGLLVNNGAMTLSSPVIVAGTLDNAGAVTVANYDALQLAPGGYLRNDTTGIITRNTNGATQFDPTVYGATGGASTVANFGTIENINGDAAMMLGAGGTVINGSAGGTSALIEANGQAVYIYRTSGTVSNFGTIESTPTDGGDGVVLAAGGVVTNGASGSTAALISGQAYGIVSALGTATVTNFGTITGGGNPTDEAVLLGSGGTVVNAGEIAGANGAAALRFGGSDNLLVLEQGFSFNGAIIASGTGNQVELLGSAADAVTANYNSLDLTDFQTIAFAPGAGNYATLDITSDVALPGTIAGFVGLHDTIDLTALSDAGNNATTSFNSLTDVLTITGDNGSVQLQLGSGDYAGLAFVASQDGSGGTMITPEAARPPVITGTRAGQLINDDQTDRPFFGVTITDPDVGASETVTITLNVDGLPSDANGTLSGSGLTKTGTGVYTLNAGTPAEVTAELQALVFTPSVLDLPPGSAAVTDMTLSISDGVASSPTTDTTTSVAIVPCFAAGTRIATPRGAIPVERLREGDTVLTVSGKPQPIQWIGCRTLDCNRHISPERVKPIRVAPHAFGENRPRRALLLSPDHSVFVEDVLIPIKHLVNGTTVTQIDVAAITYYHIELPRHDVLLAEGLPAETYLETGARFAFENGGGAMELHPNFAPDEARVGMVWRNFSYAPLIGSDGQLERVRARLALQALMLQPQADAAPDRTQKRAGRS